uniref:Uncharacterized protein n=1 Tax=Caenorhabditis japonica TaxID=281687 RepID=A0A8R1HP01_CAEJA
MNINNENDNCEDSSLIAEYFEKKTAIYDFHFPPLDNDIEVGEELSNLAKLQERYEAQLIELDLTGERGLEKTEILLEFQYLEIELLEMVVRNYELEKKLAMLQSMNQLINTFNLLLVDRMNSVLKTCKREDIFVLPGAVDLFFLTQRPEKIHLPSLVFERPTRREKRREAR